MKTNKFELSIISALGIIIFFNIILQALIMNLLQKINPTISNKTLESILIFSEEVICVGFISWLVLKYVRFKYDRDFNFCFLGSLSKKMILIFIILTIGYFFLYRSSIGILTDKIPLGEFFSNYLISKEKELNTNIYPFLISIIIIIPFLEEILFRGVILTGFLNKHKPLTAIVLSAFLFGLIHLNIPQIINATITGLVLGYVFFKTNSLLLCIGIHSFLNILAVLMASNNFKPNLISFTLGLLIFAFGIWQAKRHLVFAGGNENKT